MTAQPKAPKRSQLELPEDRPASFDEEGHHVALNPADVHGRFRRWRNWFYLGLVLFFLALPWTKFQGHQTLLLDIPNRRFAFFGVTFWAHDVPMIFFILGLLTVGLCLVTTVWGRVWCGWGCPQTVFIDLIYRRIERWIEGSHHQRRKLSLAPMSWEKFWKRSLKWFLFWFVSTNIAHSFTAYFVGAERLAQMSLSAPWESWTPFIFVTVLTAMLMFDFGWFREQFCMIMCPYGRFQSVLMDQNSLAVLYDEGRGEPRKGAQAAGSEHADCINCYRCVAVCPTGVDIRRGVQMECIACTACIDACDEIMDTIDKPHGLIRYSSEAEMSGGTRRKMRPASLIYAGILVVLAAGFSISVAKRGDIDMKFLRAVDTPYTQKQLDDGTLEIVNHYRVNVKNQSFEDLEISLELVSADDRVELVAPTYPLALESGEVNKNHVFFKFPGALTERGGKYPIDVIISWTSDRQEASSRERLTLVGPFK